MTREIVSDIYIMDDSGNEDWKGQRVADAYVTQLSDPDGHLKINIRDYPKKGTTLTLQFALPAVMAAICQATLEVERPAD